MGTKKNNKNAILLDGRIGNIRLYIKNGRTIMRAVKNSKKQRHRSRKQMEHSIKFASLMGVWKILSGELPCCFSNKLQTESYSNAFVEANPGLGVYLTKKEKSLGESIALPVVVADGKLPETSVAFNDDGMAVTNLDITGLELDLETTIGELAKVIVANNDSFNYDDELSVLRLQQESVRAKAYVRNITLDPESQVPVKTLIPNISTFDDRLAFTGVSGACIGMIHRDSRDNAGHCQLTADKSQQTLIQSYQTEDRFLKAAKSYGGFSDS